MSYFTDLTRHTYSPTGDDLVLNVGWLDIAHPFPIGETSAEFRSLLCTLCKSPMILHRGFHSCQFCPKENDWPPIHPERRGNGQIRVKDKEGIWYAAPTMINHYVVEHAYRPPDDFIKAVLDSAEIGKDEPFIPTRE